MDGYIGIDIGGVTIKAGMVDATGKVCSQRQQLIAHETLETLTQQIVQLTEELRRDCNFKLEAIGIGVPALVSKNTQKIVISPSLRYLDGVELKHQMEERLQVPVYIENDANVGAYGEMIQGAGREKRDFAYISIGSRVGAGIILDREIYSGKGGYAGELGHMTVDPEGKSCFCGSNGCLERYVSSSSIGQRVEERILLNPSSALQIITDRPITAQDVFAAAQLGDKMACVIVGEVSRYLGIAIAALINLMNMEMVILGGGIMGGSHLLLQPTIDEVKRRALSPSFEDCAIVASALGPSAGVVGSALLARDYHGA
ncbi:MAG: ROK family protein [Terriglobia bacterium]